MYWGVTLVVMTALNELVHVFLDRHKDLYIETQGHKAKNLLKTVIFKKFSLISSATNKVYQEGQILNLMSSDASKAEEIFDMIAGLSKLPVNFFFIMIALFWHFGISFLIGLIPFLLSFMINKNLA
jgi:hypothetical protein